MVELRNACVKDLVDLGMGAYILRLSPEDRFDFDPGQHTQIEFCDSEGSFLRYYSLANAPRVSGELEFFIQAVDTRLTAAMKKLTPKECLKLTPPQGQLRIVNKERDIVLIGGGTGIAPLHAIFEHLTKGFRVEEIPHNLHVLYGVRHTSAMFAYEQFLRFHHANLSSIKICITAEQGQLPDVKMGRVTQHMKDLLLHDADYYLCGPPKMLDAVREQLLSNGITAAHIFLEGY